MDNELEIGDEAETIDDDIKGKVVSISSHEVILLTTDGFEMPFKPNEIIKISNQSIDITLSELNQVLHQELYSNRKHITSKKTSSVHNLEVDLHIHELIDDARNLSNYEILNIQMDHAKKRLEWAIQKKLKAVVFIHGVGQGVLREELYTLFRRYDNLEYFDANYQTYGVGATEVRIY
jgi:dsDNA-specific endonuclease/ATPase MutS2